MRVVSVRAKSRTEEQKSYHKCGSFLFSVMLNLFQHLLIRPFIFIVNCAKKLKGLYNFTLQKHNPLTTFV